MELSVGQSNLMNKKHDMCFLTMAAWIISSVLFVPFPYSDYLFKLLLIGDSGVGKSCLLLRFAVSFAPKANKGCFFMSIWRKLSQCHSVGFMQSFEKCFHLDGLKSFCTIVVLLTYCSFLSIYLKIKTTVLFVTFIVTCSIFWVEQSLLRVTILASSVSKNKKWMWWIHFDHNSGFSW